MYITFEGPEACGKSTQANLLHEKLDKLSLLTKEPGSPHSSICIDLRSMIFKNDIVEEAALFCFLADRSQHVRTVIEPALKSNQLVISDRSSLSTIIYHIASKCPDPVDINYVSGLFPVLDIAQHIQPDICFLAGADYEWTLQQLAERNSLDRIELRGDTFHKEIHSLFSAIAGEDNKHSAVKDLIMTEMKLFPKRIVKLPSADANSTATIHDFICSVLQEAGVEI